MRCDYCGRAISHSMTSATSWVPKVTICKRAGCEDVARRAKEMYTGKRSGWVAFDDQAKIYVDAELIAGWEDPADPFSDAPRRTP